MNIGRKTFVAVFAFAVVIGGGVAAADTPTAARADNTAECGGLLSAKDPKVAEHLKKLKLDPEEAQGPIGTRCKITEETREADYEVKLVGLPGTGYKCKKADEKTKEIHFFNECDD
jgi:hypothetical protein